MSRVHLYALSPSGVNVPVTVDPQGKPSMTAPAAGSDSGLPPWAATLPVREVLDRVVGASRGGALGVAIASMSVWATGVPIAVWIGTWKTVVRRATSDPAPPAPMKPRMTPTAKKTTTSSMRRAMVG